MLTRSIDAAVEALLECHERVPFLRDLQPEGSARRLAWDNVLTAIERAKAAMTAPDADTLQDGGGHRST